MTNKTTKHWAVIGGGMLGMTMAYRLRQQGHNVTLIEAASGLGGLAMSWKIGDVRWDQHYHVTLLSDSVLRRILKELDLDDKINWRETKTGVYANKNLYSVSNIIEFLTFPVLNLIDKFRLGMTIFLASKIRNWKRLEKISVARWLRRYSGNRTYERFWLPLLRSKLGDNYRIASAAFIWATIARLYAARRSGLKKEMFGYVRGGYSNVLQTYKRHLEKEGVKIQLNSPVNCVESSKGGFNVHYKNSQSAYFDNIVVTVAAPMAAKMCPQLNEQEKSLLREVQYQGVVCASLLLRKPLSKFYVTNILDQGFPFTGVIEMTTLVDCAELNNQSLVYLPKYLTQQDEFYKKSDEEIEEIFISSLLSMYPALQRDDITAFRISRVRYVCPVPTINYSDSIPPIVTSVPGLYVVNSSHITNGTLNVNESIQLAEQVAQMIKSRA